MQKKGFAKKIRLKLKIKNFIPDSVELRVRVS